MKLTKLLEIENELIRFKKRLDAAIYIAKNDTSGFWDGDHWNTDSDKPRELMECLNCKESAALKRGAIDLKKELTGL